METNLVFVYGSLMKGEFNHHLLKDAEFVGEGSIYGKMYSLIYYPAVVHSKVKQVYGEVYRVSEDTLKNLDELEGYRESLDKGMYLRRTTKCTLFETGEVIKVSYYIWGSKYLPFMAEKYPEKVRWHREREKDEEWIE